MGDKTQTRSIGQIEADLATNRERLASTVDTLVNRVSPAELKRRAVEAAQDKARGVAFTPDGTPRWDRLAMGLGIVAGVALSLGLARRAFHD